MSDKTTILVHSVEELVNNIVDYTFIYRGQPEDHPLKPTIGRYDINQWGYNNWWEFQNSIIKKFEQYSTPYLHDKKRSLIEWLILTQHYGAPTCLLDWSTNPLKALFFAVEDKQFYHSEGVLYAIEPIIWLDDISMWQPSKYEDSIQVIFPTIIDERVSAQESCFTVFPLSANSDELVPLDFNTKYGNIDRVVKYVIPAEAKDEIRLGLRRFGITHMSLFPGLAGIGKFVSRYQGYINDI